MYPGNSPAEDASRGLGQLLKHSCEAWFLCVGLFRMFPYMKSVEAHLTFKIIITSQ